EHPAPYLAIPGRIAPPVGALPAAAPPALPVRKVLVLLAVATAAPHLQIRAARLPARGQRRHPGLHPKCASHSLVRPSNDGAEPTARGSSHACGPGGRLGSPSSQNHQCGSMGTSVMMSVLATTSAPLLCRTSCCLSSLRQCTGNGSAQTSGNGLPRSS